MTLLVHLADRILGRPLLVLPEKIELSLGVLGNRIGLDVINVPSHEMSRFVGRKSDSGGYRVTPSGIAVVSILGTLVNRGAWVGASSGLTSYEGLCHQLKEARKDGAVRGILLDMDTPGGEASGAFEVPDLIRDIRKTKPVFAFAADMACSAGYAIAAAAHEIWTTRTGMVGSIGVVLVHMDRSAQMAQDGLKPTIIAAGRKKTDGNPYEPLPANVRERLQGEADSLRETFIASVVAGRPALSAEAVRATEAGVYTGQQALAAGLVDGIGTFDAVLERLTQRLGGTLSAPAGYTASSDSQPTPESIPMTTTAQIAPAPDQTQLDAAAARGRGEGERAGRTAERERIRSILTHPEAEGRQAQAVAIALDTDMSAEAAGKVLAAAPKVAATAAGAGSSFYTAVAAHGGDPKVRADDAEANGGGHKSTLVAQMSARFKKGA